MVLGHVRGQGVLACKVEVLGLVCRSSGLKFWRSGLKFPGRFLPFSEFRVENWEVRVEVFGWVLALFGVQG